MRDRDSEIMYLRTTSFDLLVIGGGVHGAAIAREAARRGARVAVIDRGDFAGGASSNSLKILHGGFRYLRQLDLPRMRSSIRCRREWAQLAPDLVKPLACAIAATGSGAHSLLGFAAALRANDLISGDRNRGLSGMQHIPRGQLLRRAQYDNVVRNLLGQPRSGGALWWDAVALDTEALVLGLIEQAASAGACAANYVEACELLVSGNCVQGVGACDLESGETFEIRASHTVCAAGAGENELTTEIDRRAGIARPSCWGVNVILKVQPASDIALAAAVPAAGMAGDSRHLFFVPWRNRTMVGTHYVACDGPQTESDQRRRAVSELLGLARQAAPAAHFRQSDICFVHWGRLALSRPWRGIEPAPLLQTPRLCDYGLTASRTGLWSIEGPKFTSALDVARWTLRRVLPTHSGPTDIGRLDQTPGLRKLVSADPEASGAEAAQTFAARRLGDTVLRRNGLGSAGHPGIASLEACARGMARTLGWGAERTFSEVLSLSEYYRERHSCADGEAPLGQEKP